MKPFKIIVFFPLILTAQILNTELVGHLTYDQNTNDIWGYVAEDGTEYALVGTYSGTSIVDVSTDPGNPAEVAFISGQGSIWRDIKTYDHYMYVGTEASQGIQVVDIQDPPNAQLVYTWTGVTNSHNIFQADGYLYVVGAGGDNIHILDLSNPAQPVKVGGWNGEYIHDIYVRGDYAYGCGIYTSTMYIIDISDKANPTTVTSWSYPGSAHATWLSEDGNFLITADEMSDGHVKIWDISDFNNINMVSEWMADDGFGESVHNVFVRDNYIYASHYVLGLQIIDISDPYNPVTAGYYDTYPGNSGLYEGAWGAYPFTESCYTYVSDISNGLFVVNFSECVGIDPLDPEAPANFTAYSDFSTPTSVSLTWDDPTELHNGEVIGDFVIDVVRDEVFITTVNQGTESYIDNGLVDGQLYAYTIQSRLIMNDSASVSVEDNVYAGGSPTPASPGNFSVDEVEGAVTISWMAPTTQDDGTPLDDLTGINIYRNGTIINTISAQSGQPGSYVDYPATGFTYGYQVSSVDNESPPNESNLTGEISIWVGDVPHILIWEPEENTPLSGAVILETLQTFGKSAYLTSNLIEFGAPADAEYDAVFVLLGIYTNNHILSASEAGLLVSYLNGGGNIYMEGGDTWAYDPQTDLHTMFFISGENDGNGDTDIISGVDGTPFSVFSFDYAGENNWMDHLVPVNSSFAIFKNNSPVYFNGVAFDGNDYKTIGTSFEFGGLMDGDGGTKMELLETILNFFDINETIGIKGDVNGDGILDIFDVVKIINFMLGVPPSPTDEQAWAADLNNDTVIDVFDIVLLVDIILGQGRTIDSSKISITKVN